MKPRVYLEKIINNEIGSFNFTDDNKLLALRLIQPTEEKTPFEFSQLVDQCWRADIYPPEDGNKIEFSLNLKFCVKKNEENLTVRRYGYLLEAKVLDHTNKE